MCNKMRSPRLSNIFGWDIVARSSLPCIIPSSLIFLFYSVISYVTGSGWKKGLLGGGGGGGGIRSEIMNVRFDRAPVSQPLVVHSNDNDNDNGLVSFLIHLDSSNLFGGSP
jgi:hypothetical protein